MYYASCEWYVDMGEHNKPLCERNNLRPAKCGECHVYIKSIEDENRKLRDYAHALEECRKEAYYCEFCPHCNFNFEDEEPHCDFDFDALRAAAWMKVDK